MKLYEEAKEAYAAGKPVRLVTGMGSCWCGDTLATIQSGHMVCEGMEPWQQYEGPVSECQVGYGMDVLAMAIHAKTAVCPYTEATGIAKSQRWD